MSQSNGWIPKVLDLICNEKADHGNDVKWLNTPSKFRSALKRNSGLFCKYISLVQKRLREAALQRVEAASKPPSSDKTKSKSCGEITALLLHTDAFISSSQEVLESTASFASLADNDKKSLLQAFAPQMLLLQFMKHSSGSNDLLVLSDASVPAQQRSLAVQQLTTTLQDIRKRLIPRFDDLKPDDVELALLATISLWNPQAVSNAATIAKVSRVQQLSMFLLQRYLKVKDRSRAGLRFGNLLVFLTGLANAGDILLRGFRLFAEDGMIKPDSLLKPLLCHKGSHAQPEEALDDSAKIGWDLQRASVIDNEDIAMDDSECAEALPHVSDQRPQRTAASSSVDNDASRLLAQDSCDDLSTDSSHSPYDPLAPTEELIESVETLTSPPTVLSFEDFCRWFARRESTASSNDSFWTSSSDSSDWDMESHEANLFAVPLLGPDCTMPLSASLNNRFLIQF